MSFSSEVKREICESNDFSRAELYMLLYMKGTFLYSNNDINIEFTTKHEFIMNRVVFLFKKLFNKQADVILREMTKLDRKPLYIVKIIKSLDILVELDLTSNLGLIKNINNLYSKDITGIVRGAFLAGGSINPPGYKYRLELICKNIEEATYLKQLLDTIIGEIKYTKCMKGHMLYTNHGTKIGDFIRLLNLNVLLFSFEDARIKKDAANYANRYNNCDNANINKSVKNATKQILLINKTSLELFNSKQLKIIKLRKTYPSGSYQEMSDNSLKIVKEYIPKSTISRILKDIEKIAKK